MDDLNANKMMLHQLKAKKNRLINLMSVANEGVFEMSDDNFQQELDFIENEIKKLEEMGEGEAPVIEKGYDIDYGNESDENYEQYVTFDLLDMIMILILILILIIMKQ